MNVLVVGATGDVGSEAAKFAVAKGHTVRALVRSTSNRDKLGEAKGRVEFFEGDMLDTASLEQALAGMNAIIVSIRLTPGEIKKGRTYKDVEEQGIKNLIEVGKKKGVKKIIHVSAAGVGPHCRSDMYGSKHRAEEAIRNSGLDYTIFKPSGMFKDFRFFHIPTVIKLGETSFWPTSPVEFHMNPLSHVDLGQCMADALTNPKASNKSLEIGGPETITMGELLDMIAKEAGINAHYTKGVSKEDLIARVRSNPQQAFFSAEQLEDFMIDKKMDHSIIKEIFGIQFQKIADFLKKAVPEIKAAMAQAAQQPH